MISADEIFRKRYHHLVDVVSALQLKTGTHNELWRAIEAYAIAYNQAENKNDMHPLKRTEKEEQELRKRRYAKLIEEMKQWPEQDRQEAARRGMTHEEYCQWFDKEFKLEPVKI